MEYITHGVCSKKIIFDVKDDIIQAVEFIGGCAGNTQGVARLVTGMSVDEAISKLEGIRCGFKNTSCPDQLAKALKETTGR
ncbi:MAG: TIGR03905 family TSCPD domain-containing protein [Lachnospiraceae bacterium]